METALRTGEPQRDKEVAIERPDGSQIVALVQIEPLKSPAGHVQGALSCFQDITERKRAERDWHHLVSVVESSDDAIVSKDLDGVIVSWNRGAERLFGYAAEEIVGKPVTVLMAPEQLDEEPKILEHIRRGERVEHYETIRRRKDGSLIDISLTVSPVKDGEGRVVGASKIARDITERKRADAALTRRMEEQAALYRLTARLHRAASLEDIYAAALDAIFQALRCERASILLFDEAGAMRFVAWRDLSEDYRRAVEGHSPWTPETRNPRPICIPDVASSDIPEMLKATVAREGIAALAFIPLVAKGKLIGKFMTYYPAPHVFAEEEVDLAFTIARQLGFSIERMQADEARSIAEEALRDSERRLELALSAGRMGAWEWNIDTGEVIWSPGLEKIHGLEPGEFGGKLEDFKRGIHPEDVDRVLADIAHALATQSDYHTLYRMKRPDGAVRWLEAFGRFAPCADGKAHKIAGVCMDVTERREAELERDLLVAELSHRVKNTLATVLSIERQSFLRAPCTDEARRSFSARIRALAQSHGRLAEGKWSGVSLESILLDELAPYRREDGSNLRLSGPAISLNPKCAVTLGMAIHELATNAAKYGALSLKTGRVDVAWEVDRARNALKIRWSEAGGPAVAPPERAGFGRLLLERALASDLKGKVKLDFAASGLRCAIELPLAEHVGRID
jgi:PAS domain S-box-containing protein